MWNELLLVGGLVLLVYLIEKMIFFGIKVKKNYDKIGKLNKEFYKKNYNNIGKFIKNNKLKGWFI